MKNVVAYIRVSTEGQLGDDKYGLDVQREQIEKYCREHDYKIEKWFADEGESGAKLRQGFDEIVYGDITNPPYEAVVVAKSDRVARDINVYFYYEMLLKQKNIELISISEDFGQFGAFAPFLKAFTLCVADMERQNITKRTSAGRIAKSKTGGYSGGRAPMGYKIVNGGYEIVEEEAKAVRRAFELRENNHLPIRGVVDALNAEGYKTRGGKEFVISTVQSILGNKLTYQGYYRYGKNGDWVKGQHKEIL